MVTKLSRHSYQQLYLQRLHEQNFNDPGLIDLEMICNLDLADLVLSCNASGSMTLTFVRCSSNSRFHGYASIIAKILFCIVNDFYLWNKTACYVTQKNWIERHLLLLTQFSTIYTTLEHRGVVASADVPANRRGEGESPFPQRVKIKILWPLRLCLD